MRGLQCVLQKSAIVGECPTWCERQKVLYWVDIQGKTFYRFHPKTGENESFYLGEIVTAIALCEDENKVLLSLRKTIVLYDLQTLTWKTLASIEDALLDNRFNDAKCDPQGRFWAGTMNNVDWSSPEGALYRYSSKQQCEQVQSEVTCSNGMGWSPDQTTLYFTDCFRYTVYAFDYDKVSGHVSNRRPFIELAPDGGAFPDGLTVDAQGLVWSAHVGTGQIVRYDSSGKPLQVIQLPVLRATSCTFGGDALQTLYITTATEGLTPEQKSAAPLSGSLFAIETDVVGLPTHRIPRAFYE